jgi:hypothetical protein
MRKIYWAFIPVFLGLTLLISRPIFRGFVPIPMDVLVAGYFPWLDYKWGFPTGVPYKNASLTDVYSQNYIWRTLAVGMLKGGELPLWNPYSFSGTPLLANLLSAPFYPLNLLMILLGDIWGWSAMILFQPLLSMLFMYLFLRQIKLFPFACIFGSIVFAFSGFMTTYLEYGTSGQIFLWLPLLLYVIEKYYYSQKNIWLLSIPILLFPVLTGGFFQPAAYVCILSFLYFVFRSPKKIIQGILVYSLGLCLSAVQLIPSFELFSKSIRNYDHNIIEYGYGLLPLRNFITFFSPDFFGNPATHNFWGFMGYQETSGYFGIVTIGLLVSAFCLFRKNFHVRFFGLLFFISLFLAFDTPLGGLVYSLKIPGFSTGYASRLLLVTGACASVLAAIGLNYFQHNLKMLKKASLITFLIVLASAGGIVISLKLFSLSSMKTYSPISQSLINYQVSLRNLILPLGLSSALILLLSFRRLIFLVPVVIIFLSSFDFVRYTTKFNPFVPSRFMDLSLPAVEYMQKNIGFYRLERERSEMLPPNIWLWYGLMSPSGYDPLQTLQYGYFYRIYNSDGGNNELQQQGLFDSQWFTRYSELEAYNSPFLDLAGVKYLAAIKRNENSLPDRTAQKTIYKISDTKFKQVFSDGATVVLENTTVLPRVMLYDSFDVRPDYREALKTLWKEYDFRSRIILDRQPPKHDYEISASDSAKITNYSSNTVGISTQNQNWAILMLSDSNYPGWKAKIDGVETTVYTADGIYRALILPPGQHQIVFRYSPDSFLVGFIVSSVSFMIVISALGLSALYNNKKWQ